MSESVDDGKLNPYAAPKEATVVAAELNAGEVKVDDPTALARWTIGLLVFLTAYDLLVHGFLTFGSDGRMGALASMALVETTSLLMYLVYFVVFLCWMYRVMWNSKRVDPGNAKIGPGYGVGSFFIPILNFWVPCLALMQASRTTLGEARLVLLWWITSMALLVIALSFLFIPVPAIHLTEGMINGNEPISQLTWFDHFIAASDPVITFLEVVMILALTRRQREWSLGPLTVKADQS